MNHNIIQPAIQKLCNGETLGADGDPGIVLLLILAQLFRHRFARRGVDMLLLALSIDVTEIQACIPPPIRTLGNRPFAMASPFVVCHTFLHIGEFGVRLSPLLRD